jgi:uncharacterized glyoxalase superfamily protein PhnB
MTGSNSITTSVEVPVDPGTAFKIFTEELDCWWLQGPINFYDSTRAHAMRMELGIGGRILEVYDAAADEGLEVARIVAWEPGSRLEWTSSIDDVRTEVRFSPSTDGTVVRVTATIPEGGEDKGGTSWTRVTPSGLGRWVARRDHVAHVPVAPSRLALMVHYAEPIKAATWLTEAFGLELAGRIPEDASDEHLWIEFEVGDAALVVLALDDGPVARGGATHVPWIFVDDLDGHYERAVSRGATIVEEIWEHGARAYSAADVEGYRWTFVQASPLMRQQAASD